MAYRAVGAPTSEPSSIASRPSAINAEGSPTPWPQTIGGIVFPSAPVEGDDQLLTYVPPGAAPLEVKFYDGVTLLATVNAAPWVTTMAAITPGTHTIKAVVDGVSTVVYAFVVPPTPPVMFTPVDQDSYNIGDSVPLSVGDFPAANTTKVEWYVNGVLTKTDLVSPYTQAWDTTGQSAGAKLIVARRYYTGVASGTVDNAADDQVTVTLT